MEKPILVFQTDFTYKEGAVCAMYGVVKSVDRSLEIIDGTHEIPQYDIYSASYRLMQSMPFWPEGTIFVSVVDPGVGTSRKACVAKTKNGYYIVTPDNGTLTYVAKNFGIEEVREIDETVNRLKGKGTEGVSVFHGRDLFGYCAAKLASGKIDYAGVGPTYPVEEIRMFPLYKPTSEKDFVQGIIEIDDPNFGNLWTNIPTKLLQDLGVDYGELVTITLKKEEKVLFQQEVRFDKSFGMVSKGDPILYNNELMNLSLACCQDSFLEKYPETGFGPEYTIQIKKK